MGISTKKLCAAAAALLMTASVFSGCADKSGTTDSVPEETAVQTEAQAKEYTKIEALYAEIRTEYNENLDLSDYPLTPNNVPADYSAVYEAENGEFGACQMGTDDNGVTYVSGPNSQSDEVKFKVNVEHDGFYDLNFIAMTDNTDRVNFVALDGDKIGEIQCVEPNKFTDSWLKSVYMTAGEHDVSILCSWGYMHYDRLELSCSSLINDDTYNITAKLSNPNADERTQRLYNFLCDVYGKYSLTGQFADEGRKSSEIEKIRAATGKDFAVLGLDVSGYSTCSVANGSDSNTIEYAYDWYTNGGGIVQLCWHWTTPEPYCVNDQNNPWYKSFYKEGSKINLDKAMNGEDQEAYDLLMADIDAMAVELARLRDAGVPVIWRPLHEASGGWFWWGDCKAESYIKLWNAMYDKMTNEHNLTNLIWEWNGQDPAWYPGDETVDIVSYDIYAGNHVYSSYSGTFAECVESSSERKLVALSENGCVMDPDLVMRDNARWLFWGTWSDPFTLKLGVLLNEEYTEKDILIKAYNSDRTLTLDELPDLKNYPLD
ncbi:MAG: beta-mannosidase [Oscillospiraceae bacterium]|nr:beta-mannosidase [Oscillospiraceae bacterium]